MSDELDRLKAECTKLQMEVAEVRETARVTIAKAITNGIIASEKLQALNSDLLAALKYARRMLRANKVDYDDFFVSDAIKAAEKQSAGGQ